MKVSKRIACVVLLLIAAITIAAAQGGYITADILQVSKIEDPHGTHVVIDVDNRKGMLEEITVERTHLGADFIVYPSDGEYIVIYGKNLSVAYSDTDATTAIEWAINHLPTDGGVVRLASGTYTVTSTIDILRSNVVLAGSGLGTVLYLASGSNCVVIRIGDGSTTLSGIVIRDIEIDGNKAGNTGSTGIHLYGGGSTTKIENSSIINCYIHDCNGDGIKMDYAEYILIKDCRCINNYAHGIHMRYSSYNQIMSNICNYNGGNGIWLDTSCAYNKITKNTCNNNGGGPTDWFITHSGISLFWSSNHNIISDNTCNSNDGYGIDIDQSSSYCTITGNICNYNGGHGIYCVYGDGGTVVANRCSGNSGSGIAISGSGDNWVVDSNVCSDNGGNGISLSGSWNHITENCVITSNRCYSNSNYGISIGSYVTDTLVSRNSLSGNTAGAISDSGSRTMIKGNKGYTTENSGTITGIPINGTPAGTTLKYPVAHGLAAYPDGVQLTLYNATAQDYEAMVWWDVNSTDSNYIDIYVKIIQESLTSGATAKLQWRAWT